MSVGLAVGHASGDAPFRLRAEAEAPRYERRLADDEVLAQVPLVGKAFMTPLLPGLGVQGVVRSATRVDVGLWFRRARIWVFATAEGLLLAAWGTHTPGPRPWLRVLPAASLVEATYNHVTGALLLRPADGDPVPPLVLPPHDGYRLLAHIHHCGGRDAQDHR